MADIEPPSFSLGFDLDLDSEPPPAPAPAAQHSTGNRFSQQARASTLGSCLGSTVDEDDDFETPMVGYAARSSEPASTLKRLRRGPALKTQRPEPKVDKFTEDDDIEEFSSQDDEPPDNASNYHRSVCSSSKFPLNGHGSHAFRPSRLARQLNETRNKSLGKSSAPIDKEGNGNKLVFPEFHVSPLRKFQLIESDSDEATPSKGLNEVINKVDYPSNGKFTLHKAGTSAELKKTKIPDIASSANDLWKEIRTDRSFHIPTPALDEFCEEYSRSLNNKRESNKFEKGCYESTNLRKNEPEQITTSPPHPAFLYYNHRDSRIQDLVRARLPHFLPLFYVNNQGLKQHSTSTIDYMSQFNHQEASKQGKKNPNVGPSSTKSRKKSRKSSAVDVQEESDSWINPRVSSATAKDAGKKRVSGVCKSAGHWYTGPDGRRVYVAGNGQELSGQAAYRRYKRDSGGGFKKSKKKAAAQKKSAKKK